MSALPPDPLRNLEASAFAARHPVAVMMARWDAIRREAARLAELAEIAAPAAAAEPDRLTDLLEAAADWQRELAWQGVEDIAAMLAVGTAALDVLASRGSDARIPALALWRELETAQRGVMAMLSTADPAPATETATV